MIKALTVFLMIVTAQVVAAQPFTLDLTWDAVTTDEQGNPVDNVTAYRLYMASDPPPANKADWPLVVTTGSDPAYTLEGVELGVWHLAVTAINALGLESDHSATVIASLLRPSVPVLRQEACTVLIPPGFTATTSCARNPLPEAALVEGTAK